MSHLALFVLGPPRLERDGAPIKVSRRKAIALTAYLAITGASHPRDSLAGLFWPEYHQEAARAALSSTLWALKALDGDWLNADRETISLNRAHLWVDADHWHSLLDECRTHHHPVDQVCPACLAPLTEAIQLYRGEFMAGFTLRDSVLFDEWQVFQTEGLHRKAVQMIEKLVRLHTAQGDLELAITYARRWLTLDPFHDPAHRQLMQLYAWSGQPAAALRQYQECVRLLKESGLGPQEETTRLYQDIQYQRLPSPPTPVRPLVPLLQQHNLPVPATPFLGREKELAEITRRLYDPACRLVTLIGPGGIGKTRLAIQAAAENAAAFPDGVCFIPLASLSSAELLAPTLASAIEFSLQGEADPQLQLVNYLRGRRMLLILDNLEQLCEGAGLLADILSSTSDVKLLVTSRESLSLQWEWFLQVQGLDFPKDDKADALEAYSAVQLFLHSASQVCPGFSLCEADKPFVIRICRFLDGMPLGIELAAAWTQSLSCREIALEIERDLDFLATWLRDVPQRHRSLRNVFDHSWGLLSEIERKVLGQLSVFRGGFTRQAAEQVAGASLPLLSTLMRKSFLRRGPTGRYEILEALRQYAGEKLGQTRHVESQTRDMHCAYYANLLQYREKQLRALEEIAEEIENVRAAWQWAIASKKMKEIGQALESLYLFYERRGWLQEGEEAFEQAAEMLREIDSTPDSPPQAQGTILGQVLVRQGRFCAYRSHFDKAKRVLQESLVIFRSLGAQSEMAFSLHALGTIAWSLGEYAEAKRLLEESLAIRRENNDQWGIARCLGNLGVVASRLNEPEESKRLHQEAFAISQEIGDQWGMANNLTNLGVTCEEMGEYLEAKRLHEESSAIFKELGDQQSLANSVNNLGYVLCALGENSEAKRCLEEAWQLALDALSVSVALQATVGLAIALANEGKQDQIAGIFERTLRHPVVHGEIQARAEQILSELDLQLSAYLADYPEIFDRLKSQVMEIKRKAMSPSHAPTPPRSDLR